jgi:NAD(P)H-hydrate repair Nnr-like enzyme with NAD(P)H-hydrate dehydratase domain
MALEKGLALADVIFRTLQKAGTDAEQVFADGKVTGDEQIILAIAGLNFGTGLVSVLTRTRDKEAVKEFLEVLRIGHWAVPEVLDE